MSWEKRISLCIELLEETLDVSLEENKEDLMISLRAIQQYLSEDFNDLSEEEKACGVVASSAGNHAQGVAISATKLGIKSTIVMPKNAPLAKIFATRKYGGDVVLEGEIYEDNCYR